MARDEKTRKKTEEGEAPKKNGYLLVMELMYRTKLMRLKIVTTLEFLCRWAVHIVHLVLQGEDIAATVLNGFGINSITGLKSDLE